MPPAESFDITGLAVDGDTDIDISRITFLRGKCQSMLKRTQDNFLAHVLFARQRINQLQNFNTHALRLLKFTCGTNRALSMSAIVKCKTELFSLSSPSNSSASSSPSGGKRIP